MFQALSFRLIEKYVHSGNETTMLIQNVVQNSDTLVNKNR